MKYLQITVQAEPIDPIVPVDVLVDGRRPNVAGSPTTGGDSFELFGPERLDGGRPQTVRVQIRRQPLFAAQVEDWIRRDVADAAARAGVDIDDAELARQATRLARRATSPFRVFRRS